MHSLNFSRAAFCLAAVILPAGSAHAEGVEAGADALAGIAADDRPLGNGDDRFSGGFLPSVQFDPGSFVVQVDGMLFEHRKDTSYGGALHAGLRTGDRGFVGAYGSISTLRSLGGLETYRIGGEFSQTWNDFTLAAVAGHEHTERAVQYVTTTATDDVYAVYGRGGHFFAFADLKYQPSDKFRLSVGYRYTGDVHAAAAGVGVGLSHNASIIAEGRLGQHDYKAGFIGLRILFGGADGEPSKLLDNRLIEDLFSESNTRRILLDPLPPPPPTGGCGSCGGYCD